MRISPSSFAERTSRAFGRVDLYAARPRSAARRELKALHNAAFAAGQAASKRKPVLVKVLQPEPTAIPLEQFLRSSLSPVIDLQSVELPAPARKGIRFITRESVEQVLVEVLR